MPVKVLVISDYRDYHSARPESNIFIGLARLGYDITLMTYKEGRMAEEMESAGIRVLDFHPTKKFDKKEIKIIRQYLVDHNIDIMHLFNSEGIVNGIRAAKGLPVKVILYRGFCGHIHWYDPSAYFKFLHPRVDYIHCNSIGVEQLIRRNLLFSSKDKAITINKGHNVDWYNDYKPRDIRKELGLEPDSFLLITVANNRKMKGIPYLLKAFNLLPREANIHLLLVGKNMDSKSNLALVAAGGNQHKVHFTGFQKNALEIVAACNVFVLPSIYGESITKSVIEAMCLSVAPVITDIPGNIELMKNGESGLVVPAKNPSAMAAALLSLYKDRALLQQLGTNAREHIRTQLNEKRTITEMDALYKRILS